MSLRNLTRYQHNYYNIGGWFELNWNLFVHEIENNDLDLSKSIRCQKITRLWLKKIKIESLMSLLKISFWYKNWFWFGHHSDVTFKIVYVTIPYCECSETDPVQYLIDFDLSIAFWIIFKVHVLKMLKYSKFKVIISLCSTFINT